MNIVNAFQKNLKQSNRKPNKIWVDKGCEFYNSSFKKWLQGNDVVMYSTHNEGKSVVAERFIRTLKNKIYKYMISISKNVYIDEIDDIVNEYNNPYHRTIKMKPVDVKDNTYISLVDICKSKGLSNQYLTYNNFNASISKKLIKSIYVSLNEKYAFFIQPTSKVVTSGPILNIHITYRLSLKTISSNNALKNCLFVASEVKKPNNTADPDKYIYSGYGIGIDRTGQFTNRDGGLSGNVIIFGADLSNSRHATNKTQSILVLGEAFVQKLNDTTIYAEKFICLILV